MPPSRGPALPHRRLHGFARRFLNPWVVCLGIAGGRHSPIGLVRTVGRRTGRSYATPLAVHRRGDRLFVPLTYGPGARWCLNALAAGGCGVRLDGLELSAVSPRPIGRRQLPRSLRVAYRLVPIRHFLELRVEATPQPPAGPARSETEP